MKFFVVFAAILAIALASPRPVVEVQELENEVRPDGFVFKTITTDGSVHYSVGELKNAGTENEALSVNGQYSWTDEKTGQRFDVFYTADENGFQPRGAHLPK